MPSPFSKLLLSSYWLRLDNVSSTFLPCHFWVSFSSGQVRMDLEKIKTAAGWPVLENSKQLQRSGGFANFYKRFIKDYSCTAAPLTQLTSTLCSFYWTPEADSVFGEWKKLFTSEPILTHSDLKCQYVVEVDTSDPGVRAVISQKSMVNDKLHPCAFYSCCLSPTKINCDVGNCELLAIKLRRVETLVWGFKITIYHLDWPQ